MTGRRRGVWADVASFFRRMGLSLPGTGDGEGGRQGVLRYGNGPEVPAVTRRL